MMLEAIPVPLTEDEHGVIRVTGTRVPLEYIVVDYRDGASAEDIQGAYPSLKLAQVHAIISYYLSNRDTTDAYVLKRERDADAMRDRVTASFPQHGLRERLLARRA